MSSLKLINAQTNRLYASLISSQIVCKAFYTTHIQFARLLSPVFAIPILLLAGIMRFLSYAYEL